MLNVGYNSQPVLEASPAHPWLSRARVFLVVFLVVAGGGLIYDFSRTPLYRAQARLAVEPPDLGDDPVARSQFAVTEALAMKRPEFIESVNRHLAASASPGDPNTGIRDSQLFAETVPQTTVIELRAEGSDRDKLTAALAAWIEVYVESRKVVDRDDRGEALEEARHAVRVARTNVDDKQREIASYRQRHGIASTEREENPGTARLKGLHTALNDAAAKEVNAEARLKSVDDSIAQGKGVIRAADKGAIGNLEMRAVDLRERLKDLEHDYTPQYLALDPKFKALKANLARIEQQIETEKSRSQRAALIEAQEEYASAQRAVQKLKEQVEGLKQESQNFSTRFGELTRMSADLGQLQDTQRLAVERLNKLESARKPSAVKVRVLTAPVAGQDPVSPDYARDAWIALAAGLGLAVGAVWLTEYLRRDPRSAVALQPQPIIQIAYPGLPQYDGIAPARAVTQRVPLLAQGASDVPVELAAEDVSALWRAADSTGRVVVGGLVSGIAPEELIELRWRDADLAGARISVSGRSARTLGLAAPIRDAFRDLAAASGAPGDDLILADKLGKALALGDIDTQLAFLAHDAGLRHREDVTGAALHFTYAAYLARQGIKMSVLATIVGRLSESVTPDLLRLSPPGAGISVDQVALEYPGLQSA